MSMLDSPRINRNSKNENEPTPGSTLAESELDALQPEDVILAYQESFDNLAKITRDWKTYRSDQLIEPEISLVKNDMIVTAQTHVANFLKLHSLLEAQGTAVIDGATDDTLEITHESIQLKPDLADLYRLAEVVDITHDESTANALAALFDFEVTNSEVLQEAFTEAMTDHHQIFDVLHTLEAKQPIDF